MRWQVAVSSVPKESLEHLPADVTIRRLSLSTHRRLPPRGLELRRSPRPLERLRGEATEHVLKQLVSEPVVLSIQYGPAVMVNG